MTFQTLKLWKKTLCHTSEQALTKLKGRQGNRKKIFGINLTERVNTFALEAVLKTCETNFIVLSEKKRK